MDRPRANSFSLPSGDVATSQPTVRRPRRGSAPPTVQLSSLYGWFQSKCAETGIDTETDDLLNRALQPRGFVAPAMSLVAALKNFDATRDRAKLDLSLRAFVAGTKFSEKRPYNTYLLDLFREMEKRDPQPLPLVPASVSTKISGPQIAKINAMARYAATNIDQFRDVADPKFYTRAKNKMWFAQNAPETQGTLKVTTGSSSVESTGGLGGLAGNSTTRYARSALGDMCDFVISCKQGICTTFAAAVGHLLTEGVIDEETRVECVAGPNHCFCIVNRAAFEDEVRKGVTHIPAAEHWGDDWIFVDAWAGALGYPIFYTSIESVPPKLRIFLSMVLTQQYDSLTDT